MARRFVGLFSLALAWAATTSGAQARGVAPLFFDCKFTGTNSVFRGMAHVSTEPVQGDRLYRVEAGGRLFTWGVNENAWKVHPPCPSFEADSYRVYCSFNYENDGDNHFTSGLKSVQRDIGQVVIDRASLSYAFEAWSDAFVPESDSPQSPRAEGHSIGDYSLERRSGQCRMISDPAPLAPPPSALGSVTIPADNAPWVKYSIPAKQFAIELPGAPDEDESTDDDEESGKFGAKAPVYHGLTVVVGIQKAPSEFRLKDIADYLRAEGVTDPIETSATTVHGAPITLANARSDKTIYRFAVIRSQSWVYVIALTAPSDVGLGADADHVIDSFRFIGGDGKVISPSTP